MNLHEIENAITQTMFTFEGFGGREYTLELDWHEMWSGNPDNMNGTEIDGLGTLFIEAQHGGEGQGDEAWVVVRIDDFAKDEYRYFKKYGYYASFDGATFDGAFVEVEPIERLIIRYEEIR